MSIVVLLQIISTFLLTGLSWYVQLVHYPLFHFVSSSEFHQFHKAHVIRTNVMVLSLLPIEIITTCLTALYGFPGLTHTQWMFGAVLLLGICLLTVTVQMPIHNKLSNEKSKDDIEKLTRSHWIRTALWSLRLALLCVCLLHHFT
jgi:hypothetical protein